MSADVFLHWTSLWSVVMRRIVFTEKSGSKRFWVGWTRTELSRFSLQLQASWCFYSHKYLELFFFLLSVFEHKKLWIIIFRCIWLWRAVCSRVEGGRGGLWKHPSARRISRRWQQPFCLVFILITSAAVLQSGALARRGLEGRYRATRSPPGGVMSRLHVHQQHPQPVQCGSMGN